MYYVISVSRYGVSIYFYLQLNSNGLVYTNTIEIPQFSILISKALKKNNLMKWMYFNLNSLI